MPCESRTKSFKICRCICKWRCQCLIPRERKPKPPFGSSSKRDDIIGLHPKFYSGEVDSPPVGLYDPRPIDTKITATSWKKQVELEEFSATMGGRLLDKYVLERSLMKTGLGPGTHEISQWPEIILQRTCKTIRRDIGFGTVPLFKPVHVCTNPGPGYTRKSPYHYMDERKRIGSSCVPTFEYDGLRPRFQTIAKPWSLPSNLYDVKHPDSLEATLEKFTGKRGPYDLFTGPRDDSTLVGYQKPAKSIDCGDWPKSLPNELLRKSNYYKGRWSTCPRFPKKSGVRLMMRDLALCYKDPTHPGPFHYNPTSPRKPENAKRYPFNSNIEHVRPVPSSEIRPGPGRYSIKDMHSIKGHGWTSVFKSKTSRTDFIIIPSYNYF